MNRSDRLMTGYLSLLAAGVLLSCCLLAAGAWAAEVNLAWDPCANVTGYRIYAAELHADYDYTTPLYQGTATTCTVVVPDTVEMKFVARAYLDSEGRVYESANSNQVTHAVVVWDNPNLRRE